MTRMESYREEIELFRVYHSGKFGKCPECGRAVFLPCLACETELGGDMEDPWDTAEEEPLRIQLEGDERRRYEYCRLKKIADYARCEECEARRTEV